MYGKNMVKGAQLRAKCTENTTQNDYTYNPLSLNLLQGNFPKVGYTKNINIKFLKKNKWYYIILTQITR